MVSKKRLNNGVDFFRFPVIPRAPRSIRRRAPHKNSIERNGLCAFELLATVAGELLQESESSASSNVVGGKDKNGSCGESAIVPEISVQGQSLISIFKGQPPSETESDSILENTSEPVISNVSKKVGCDMKLGGCEFKNANGNPSCNVGGSVCYCKVENKQKKPLDGLEGEKCLIGELSMFKASNVKEPNEECVNSNMLVNLDSSVQFPSYREPVADAFLQKHSTGVNLGIRDDDENSYGCKKICIKSKPFKRQPRMQYRRMRKMLTSKYRKVPPKLKGYELFNTSEGMKLFYHYRKRIYTRERCQQTPLKKRKLSDHRFSVACDQDTSSDSISNLPEKGSGRASGTLKAHKKSKDSHVKFSIKSFKVPELFIEVPETASVGSLKRNVMEAVTAILGSGIRVGVVLQGKKVRDDNRTLQQAGISQTSNLDSLDFTLEPCFTQVSPSKADKELCSVSPCEEHQELPKTADIPMINSDTSNTPTVTKYDDNKDDDDVGDELISSPPTPANELMETPPVPDSKSALVVVPPLNMEPLTVVPVNPKLKRSELSLRRTRRPFSVAEVEALVGAVEKLGTGRWRDIKIGAFEDADHRTYVDLKDKWKTLVHTASISPHQRRGEPVPQDLLDRVLSAHLLQLKQHGKHPVEALKTADES